jgi:hypothetical protein
MSLFNFNRKNRKHTIPSLSKDEKKERERVSEAISKSEHPEHFLPTWHEHVVNRDEILSFTTIVDKTLYNIQAKSEETILPFEEYYGDHSMNWILIWNNKTLSEILRKNIRQVDMIQWKEKTKENE